MVPPSASRLLRAVAPSFGVTPERAVALGESVLSPATLAEGDGGGRSFINYDGTPLQVCLSTTPEGVRVRVLGDPAWTLGTEARWAASHKALRNVLDVTDALDLHPQALRCLRAAVRGPLDDYTRGFVWLGAGLDGGAAVYVDTMPWGADSIAQALSWADEFLPDTAELRDDLERVAPYVRVVSVGVEGTDPDTARAKVYLRLHTPTLLGNLGIRFFEHPAFARVMAHLVGYRRMRAEGLVLALGYGLRDGRRADAKLDVCGHCIPRPPDRWHEVLTRIARALGVRAPDVRELLSGAAEVAFVGVGIDRDDNRRLNVYLKPLEGAPQLAGGALARAALRDGVRALAELQGDDGRFSEYTLPVGAADGWVTGLAGVALAGASRVEGARQAAELAADWLVAHRYPEGWGYNDRTGPDADSTGLAVRLLRMLGRTVPPEAEAFLAEQWVGNGYRTYPREDGWGDVHPCVTAAVGLAVSDEILATRRDALTDAVSGRRLADGTWPSYWWARPGYSTYHHLRLAHRLGVRVPAGATEALLPPSTVFELAWATGVARLEEDSLLPELVDALVSEQRPDGRWQGSAELRVTDPSCRIGQPLRGGCYEDHSGLVVTAAAVMALTEVCRCSNDPF
jgi:hypothetical protein